MHLLLAEHDYQAKDFIARGLDAEGQWIALGPSAMSFLDRRGTLYQIADDFYDHRAFQLFCEDGHRQLEEFCTHMDKLILEQYPDLKALGMQPLWFNMFDLILVFDSIRKRAFALQHIYDRYPDAPIYVHFQRRLENKPDSFLFSKDDTLWGLVAALPDWPNAARITAFDNPLKTSRLGKRKLRKRFDDWVFGLTPFYQTLVHLTKKKMWGPLFKLFRPVPSLLFLYNEYEWNEAIPKLHERGMKVYFSHALYFKRLLSRYNLATNTGRPHPRDFSIESYRCFYVGPISCYSILGDKVLWIIKNTPARFRAIFQEIKRLNSRYAFRAILTEAAGDATAHAIRQAARSLGWETIVWQHGNVGCNHTVVPFIEFNERLTANTTLVWGPKVEEAYRNSPYALPAKPVTVGSSHLDAFPLEVNPSPLRYTRDAAKKCAALYVTTNYYQHDWYYSFPPGLSDEQLYRDQLCLIAALTRKTRPAIHLVVKLYPTSEYDDPPWAAHSEGFQVVKDEARLTELLRDADLVIIDWPTTTLLQVLTTTLPTFVLMKYIAYSEPALAMLRQRAVCSDDMADLVRRVQDYVQSGRYPANVNDRTFLKAYGTYLDDRQSAERAADAVIQALYGPAHAGPLQARQAAPVPIS